MREDLIPLPPPDPNESNDHPAPEAETDALPDTEETLDEPELLESEEHSELAEWKDAMRRDFEQWLDTVEAIPSLDETDLVGTETPDLFSFYEQLAAANVETRKANRRTAEAFSQWGDTLARFEDELKPLRESITALLTATPKTDRLSQAHCLVLIELSDRMGRLAKAFENTPPQSWWGHDARWRKAWDTQRQGFEIILSHLDDLLKKEKVERLNVLDQPFDPMIMVAVATEPDPQRPHHTVIEEIVPGYRREGQLLRTAQVKVTLNKSEP